ncbi:NUDIX domain-containing protein [Lentzea tibetensis]|uniref:NUDIX domain-containing protein n=1 Tax=Lentzea tibetensis TaxID=2591470 RepID=A0A563F1T7_9PSEU|nr:NUDIX domain-containing protein [Lentzea tibetensis]TWP53873.1 NUDIX domain-containing protein [Lentzea tibetensis]
MTRDSFCSSCGARYPDISHYPRTCASCGTQVWSNPVPVAVVLLPVVEGSRTGLLVVRRAIHPVGLALVGGFMESGETWQQSAARELREEAGVEIAADSLAPHWFTSAGKTVLLFGLAPAVTELPAFTPNSEASERGILHADQTSELVFPLHAEAARRYFHGTAVRSST